LQRGLADEVVAYLDNTAAPTLEGVTDVLKNLSTNTSSQTGLVVATSNVAAVTEAADSGGPAGLASAAPTGDTTRFDLYFQATRTSDTTLDLAQLGAQQKGLQSDGATPIQVPLESLLGFTFSFGVTGDEFFVQLPTGGIEVFTNINKSDLNVPVS